MKTVSIQQKYEEQAKMLVALEMEIKELRAKAEAYDKGVEMWLITDREGNEMAIGETEGDAWYVARRLDCWPETHEPIPNYKCRKVRVCKEVER